MYQNVIYIYIFFFRTLARSCRIHVAEDFDSPHVKTFLLIQSHFSRLPVPCADYSIDLKLILEQSGRILQAFLDYAAANGWLMLCIQIAHVSQMIVQADWIDTSPYAQVPRTHDSQIEILPSVHTRQPISFCKFVKLTKHDIVATKTKLYKDGFTRANIRDIIDYVQNLPLIIVHVTLKDAYAKKVWEGYPSDLKTNVLTLKNNRLYTLEIRLTHYKGYNSKVYAPNYPKTKQEAWMILFGSQDENLGRVTVKRCIFSGKSTCQFIKFTTPNFPGKISIC